MTLPPQPIDPGRRPDRLAQVFSNLLTNAAKYTEPGGHIWLTAERQGSEAVVSGAGHRHRHPRRPAAAHLRDVLAGGPRLERSQGGLGIGLTLVRRLVEMHGGTVEARSDGPGKGSEFIVRLPLVVDGGLPDRQGTPRP